MIITPMVVVELGTVFAVYDGQMRLILADRDRAKVEAALAVFKAEGGDVAGEGDPHQVSRKGDILAMLDGLTHVELKALAKEQAIPGHYKLSTVSLRHALMKKLEPPASDADNGTDDEESIADGSEPGADSESDPAQKGVKDGR